MAGGALDGIKVVEFATMVSGPYCGKLLADMGADVVKVEPRSGDPSRECGPFCNGQAHPERSALFLYLNTSKRGVTLDLETAEGREAFQRFITWADVLVDNYPPRYLEGLGFSWDSMSALNPALVYTSITPYGRTGPRADVKGDELTLIHAGGLGNLMPTRAVDIDRAPVKMGGRPVGYHGGVTAALATIGALMGRVKTGRGRAIDVSLQEVILAMIQPNVAGNRYHGSSWSRVPDRPPATGRMKSKDGYIIVGAPEDHHFSALVELMGNPDWATGPQWKSMASRINRIMDIAPLMDEWMSQQTNEHIYHAGAAKRIAMGPINSARDVMNSRQYAARDYFVELDHPEAGRYKYAGWPYHMSATPARARSASPLLGEHNHEVYCNCLGYSAEGFDRLKRSTAI